MLQLAHVLAAPPVWGGSFAWRFTAHLVLWMLNFALVQVVVDAGVALSRLTGAKPSARTPQLGRWRFVLENAKSLVAWTGPIALAAAWLQPGAPGGWSWDYSCPAPLVLVYFSLVTLMLHDAWSFFYHRACHINKAAFAWLHAKHHEHRAALDTRTALYEGFVEGGAAVGLPLVVIYMLGAATGNWWLTFAALWNDVAMIYTGHCGLDLSLTDSRASLMLAINPMAVGLSGVPVHASPKVHEDHHTIPTKNFAFFFTYLDERYGTSTRTGPPTTLVVLLAHGVAQLLFLGNLQLLFSYPAAWVTAWLLLYCVIPPAAAAAVAQAIKLPEVTRQLFGWYMDLYRRDNAVTFVPQGAPGAFAPAQDCTVPQLIKAEPNAGQAHTQSADSTPAAADDTPLLQQIPTVSTNSSSSSKPPVYLYAVHPTGLLSRGAFLTFGARGWSSPVSGLPAVRFAVPNWLMYVPVPFLFREIMLCCGCIPADWATLKRTLQSGTSVAINPGGWAETQHLQTYNLVLQKRRGFVALAAVTGAHLVPVLALGEQDVVGHVDPGSKLMTCITSHRPHPVKVVFGEPLVPGPDESLSQLHTRYTQALLALGKEHGAKLNIVE